MTSLLRTIALATCLAAPMAVPAPAEAQTVTRVCAVNSAAVVIRTRFEYREHHHTSNQFSPWVSNGIGGSNCKTFRNATHVLIHVEVFGMFEWSQACGNGLVAQQVILPERNATLTVYGTTSGMNCEIKQ